MLEKLSLSLERPCSRGCAMIGLVLFFPALVGYARLLAEPMKNEAPAPRPFVRQVGVTLGRGDTLQSVLNRFRLDAPTTHAIVSAIRPFINPRRIRSGQGLQMFIDSRENTVRGLELPLRNAVVRVRSTPEGWLAERGESPFVTATHVVRGTLSRNLYRDGTGAGLTPAQILDLADIFQYDVDFFSDIRRGDTFSVAFEELRYLNGDRQRGRILAVELNVGGDPVRAFHHTSRAGEGAYYDGDGRSLRRAFLRAPLNFRRISSYFNLNRAHPIFRTVRPHLAIDYAAAHGTPVVSIGRGTVSFAGWRDGYGHMVEVSHANGYNARYGHFSRIASAVRKGKRVAQGEVIGYVGQSGHATGPHLHFELLRGQQKINFLALRIPPERNLPAEELEPFHAVRGERLALLRSENLQVSQAAR